MQKLAPYFDDFLKNVKNAKDEQGRTIASLSESSGVPYSAVTKLCAGTQADPKLYNSAALCDDLGLSLDRLLGLTPTGDIDKALRRVHELEIENAALKATVAAEKAQIKSAGRYSILYSIICALLCASLVIYLFVDAQIRHAGLIINGSLSLEAWLFIALISISIIASAVILVHSFRAPKARDAKK